MSDKISGSLLRANTDEFRNVHFRSEQIMNQTDAKQFKSQLQEAVQYYSNGYANAVWVHLQPTQLNLAAACTEVGFSMHHATPKQLVFCTWTDNQMTNKIPPYCSFYVASGAAVVNDSEELLLVQESNGRRKYQWGIPSGLCNEGESVQLAAERELKEETGLVGKVHDLLFVREISSTCPGDIYFAFLVKLDAQHAQNFLLDTEEIMAYQWVPIQKLQDFQQSHTFAQTQSDLLVHVQHLQKQGYRFNHDRQLLITGKQIEYAQRTMRHFTYKFLYK